MDTRIKAFVKKFGQRVRDLRLERGMSQEQLASAARLHRTQISLVERGERAAQLDTVAKLAMALDTSPSDLMPPLPLERRRLAKG